MRSPCDARRLSSRQLTSVRLTDVLADRAARPPPQACLLARAIGIVDRAHAVEHHHDLALVGAVSCCCAG